MTLNIIYNENCLETFSKKYKFFDDALPIDDFLAVHKKVLHELLRTSKCVAYNFQPVTGSKEAFFKLIGEFAQNIRDVIVWDKGTGQPAMQKQVLNSSHELILILEPENRPGRRITSAQFDRGTAGNVIRAGRGRKVDPSHGAVMPDEVADTLVKLFCPAGGTIYDPFMGSGTTAVAALKNRCSFIGSEISAEYCEIANKRISDLFI